jgi:transcriptional regulator with XRE-family HTH domain
MRAIVERVAAIRRYLGWTQEDLAERMREQGIDWQRVVVAKLESGRRSYLTVEELLALCLILEISPTDMLVPRDLDKDRPYLVAPKAEARSVDAREWVRGEETLFWRPYPQPPVDPESLFASPTGKISDPISWMPPDRAERVARRYVDFEDEEADQ